MVVLVVVVVVVIADVTIVVAVDGALTRKAILQIIIVYDSNCHIIGIWIR